MNCEMNTDEQNDAPTNGLALSKNAHWLFDAGLWSVDKNLRIIFNTLALTEHGPEVFRLGNFTGRHLQFDPAAELRPSSKMLRNHRTRFGFRT